MAPGKKAHTKIITNEYIFGICENDQLKRAYGNAFGSNVPNSQLMPIIEKISFVRLRSVTPNNTK